MTSQWDKRWVSVDDHDPKWDTRTLLIASFVKGLSVLELGSGRRIASGYFNSKGIKYYSGDLVKGENDFVVDLNNPPPREYFTFDGDETVDCVMLSGVLEYVNNIEEAFRLLKSVSGTIVFSYYIASHDITNEELFVRSENWHSHYSLRGLLDLIARIGGSARMVGVYEDRQIILRVDWGNPSELNSPLQLKHQE
jgi:hypothetical protein